MKYLLVIAIVIILGEFNLNAQDFVAGPLLGGSFSQIDGDNFGGYNKPGFNIGGFVLRSLGKDWDIQGEISFVQKGARQTPDVEEGVYDDYLASLGYIQFPLLVKYNVKKISFEAGLSIASLLSFYEEWDGVEVSEEQRVSFQNIEWSTLFGVNYHINNRIWINLRNTYSINRIRIPYNGEIEIYEPTRHWLSRKIGQYNNNLIISLYFALNTPLKR